MKNKIRSYLSRELRSLGDVSIVDEHPDWEISIIALEVRRSGYKHGVSMSVLILSPFDLSGCGELWTRYLAVTEQVKQNLRVEKGREPTESEMEKGVVAFGESTKVYFQKMN
ncbi:unnamed protein product, partial [marine sediment metagenome]